MSEKYAFKLQGRNPDVLNSIANLSSDEVFTPPAFANAMLDRIEEAWNSSHEDESIWANSEVKFLDPFTKSGVFLREIVKRLVIGLEHQIPDLQERVDHILTKQVFGAATTTLTSLLARRSLYCSKDATGKHSITGKFTKPDGNVYFEEGDHQWHGGSIRRLTLDGQGNEVEVFVDGRCKVCGASRRDFEREQGLELHAYSFIHKDDVQIWTQEAFGEPMQFDVIVGNPPYQLNDGGGEGAGATPIYDLFIQQAIKLNPRFLALVIPARWYSGGKGLDEFRKSMLEDTRILEIHDFPETEMVFPGVNIRGGVCYFLWSSAHNGKTKVVNYKKSGEQSIATRALLEDGSQSFIRYNQAVDIYKKVKSKSANFYSDRVASRNPFGIPSNFSDFTTTPSGKSTKPLFRSRRGNSKDKEVFVDPKYIKSGHEYVDKLKVLVSKASPGGDEYPHLILGEPIIAPPGSVSTETYLIVDAPKNDAEAQNLIAYMSTTFFRFMVSLVKTTQNISKGSFAFVPIMDLSKSWNDTELNKHFQLTQEEADFMRGIVKDVSWGLSND